ncbi:hypothetical protein HJC23_002584, partial [Cyclotella cryptica]
PMTTNVKEAKDLHDLLVERQIEGSVSEGQERLEINEAIHIGGGVGCFLINHSANSELRQGQRVFLPSLHLHYHGFLTTRQIQDRTSQMTQKKCLAMALHVEKRMLMLAFFTRGQSSHLLAWIYHVAGYENLIPTHVYCAMTTSERTAQMSAMPQWYFARMGPPLVYRGPLFYLAMLILIRRWGSELQSRFCVIKSMVSIFKGIDRDPSSGKLEWLRGNDHHENLGAVEIQVPDRGFEFEELEQSGIGPESLQSFIDAVLVVIIIMSALMHWLGCKASRQLTQCTDPMCQEMQSLFNTAEKFCLICLFGLALPFFITFLIPSNESDSNSALHLRIINYK